MAHRHTGTRSPYAEVPLNDNAELAETPSRTVERRADADRLEARCSTTLREKHLRGARNPFYEAIAPHPRTGIPVSLDLHTDRDERIAALVRFHADPNEFGSTGCDDSVERQ